MTAILAFAVVLIVAGLLSELADRSVLSTTVIFLIAGMLASSMGFVNAVGQENVVGRLAEISLFAILFTDGMRLGLKDLAAAWRLPGRALFFGLPLTLLGTTLLAHYLAGISWIQSILIGAVLSPTDPVFAAAIIGRDEIPRRLRELLNVESGLNDGLALPIVVSALAVASGGEGKPAELALEIFGGVALGILLPLALGRIERSRFLAVSRDFRPLFVFSIGLLVWAGAGMTGVNEYLAAFSAGVTIATTRPDLREDFQGFGVPLAELFKLAAVLMFGTLISFHFLRTTSALDFLFAALVLLAVRPLALMAALYGAAISWPEKIAAGWFGPKGFASVVFGIIVWKSALPESDRLFHLIALVVGGSIVAHSSTDVLIARWFHRQEQSARI